MNAPISCKMRNGKMGAHNESSPLKKARVLLPLIGHEKASTHVSENGCKTVARLTESRTQHSQTKKLR